MAKTLCFANEQMIYFGKTSQQNKRCHPRVMHLVARQWPSKRSLSPGSNDEWISLDYAKPTVLNYESLRKLRKERKGRKDEDRFLRWQRWRSRPKTQKTDQKTIKFNFYLGKASCWIRCIHAQVILIVMLRVCGSMRWYMLEVRTVNARNIGVVTVRGSSHIVTAL